MWGGSGAAGEGVEERGTSFCYGAAKVGERGPPSSCLFLLAKTPD